MEISVLIPVHNAVATVTPLAEGIAAHLADRDWELLFVDDASTDGTWSQLTRLTDAMPQVRAYRFEEVLGKALALRAALEQAQGKIIITMASDLQDDPADIPALLTKLDQGHDLVCGWKCDLDARWYTDIRGRIVRSHWRRMFRTPLHDLNTSFLAIRARATRQLPYVERLHRWHPVFAQHLGFSVAEIPVRVSPVAPKLSEASAAWDPIHPDDPMLVWYLTIAKWRRQFLMRRMRGYLRLFDDATMYLPTTILVAVVLYGVLVSNWIELSPSEIWTTICWTVVMVACNVATILEVSRCRKVALHAETLAAEIEHPAETANDFIAETAGG